MAVFRKPLSESGEIDASDEQEKLMEIPVPDIGAATLMVWTWATEFLPRFAVALILIIVGFVVAGWLSRRITRYVTASTRIDTTMAPVLAAIVRYGILIVILIAALGQLGVETTSLLAALGAIGLAIGLALQGTLSNIAAGFMLLWLRPFRTGDYIETDTVSGTVREVTLFVTTLDTFDGVYRFVPNSELWNTPLLNYTRNPTRMTDMNIGIAYEADIGEAKRIMLALAAEDERVAIEPPPQVFVDNLDASAVTLKFRVWIPTPDFWPTHRYLLEETKRRLEAAGIDIPFPQRVVHVVAEDDPKRDEKMLPPPRKADATD
jgi:small conductance mechanosensitive channel